MTLDKRETDEGVGTLSSFEVKIYIYGIVLALALTIAKTIVTIVYLVMVMLEVKSSRKLGSSNI